jgi:hypothetical protein
MNSYDCIENWSVSWQTSTMIVSVGPISLFNNVAITAGYNIVVVFLTLFIYGLFPSRGKRNERP